MATLSNDSRDNVSDEIAEKILLELSPNLLLLTCKKNNIYSSICDESNDAFWEKKLYNDLDLRIIEYILKLRIDEPFKVIYYTSNIITNIINKIRDDAYYKYRDIVNKYEQFLPNGHRLPKSCKGKGSMQSYPTRTRRGEDIDPNELTEEDLVLPESWMLMSGAEGDKERDFLKDRDIKRAFFNYYNNTAKTTDGQNYYGVLFLPITKDTANIYYYGTPETVTDEDILTTRVNLDEYFRKSLPQDIIDFILSIMNSSYLFIKLYIFISPPMEYPEKFKLVVQYTNDEEGADYQEKYWELSIEWIYSFLYVFFSDPYVENIIYPIIMETTKNGCHKKLCGPWYYKEF